MNFLAHFHLAHATDASRVGALLGDFARGTPESLRERFPEDIVQGIILHRAIDRFTDSHPVFLKSKQFLSPPRRRFAGIIIDIYFDHFLAHAWADFAEGSLKDFITEIYQLLIRRRDWLTPELRVIVERMEKEDWLGTYGTIPGLALTFQRMSQRRDFLAPLIGSEEDLVAHYHSFSKAFREFYPAILTYAREENPGGALSSP